MISSAAPYLHLLALNRKLFLERLKLDIPLICIGLVFIFVGRTQVELTVGKGVFLLIGFVFAAVMESQLIQRNTAGLSFYLKLPIGKKTTLALFYASVVLPTVFIFSVLFLLLRPLLSDPGESWQISMVTERYVLVLFALLFIKSLTINLMIALHIHMALVGGYFLLMGILLLLLSIFTELVAPLVTINTPAFAVLFLILTYLVSFVAVKRIGLR